MCVCVCVGAPRVGDLLVERDVAGIRPHGSRHALWSLLSFPRPSLCPLRVALQAPNGARCTLARLHPQARRACEWSSCCAHCSAKPHDCRRHVSGLDSACIPVIAPFAKVGGRLCGFCVRACQRWKRISVVGALRARGTVGQVGGHPSFIRLRLPFKELHIRAGEPRAHALDNPIRLGSTHAHTD